MRETRKGEVFQVGTDTTPSPDPHLIFKKPPPQADIVVESIAPMGGRRHRAVYGRDPDGTWRGQVEDVGHVNESSGFALIRVVEDQALGLTAAAEITEEMDVNYALAVLADHQSYEDEDLTRRLAAHLERKQEERQKRRELMRALGIRR